MRAIFVVALSIVLASAIAGSARAQSVYVGVQGGYNDLFDADFNESCLLFSCSSDATASYDGGLAIGGVVGFDMPIGLRFEGEFTYRENSFDSIDWPDAVRPTSGDVTSQAFMANVFYDSSFGTIHPYGGAGIGVLRLEFEDISDADGPLFSGERTLFVGQLIAGIGMNPLPNTTLYLDYRALFAEDATLSFAATQRPAIAGQSFDVEYWSQTVMVGIRQSF